MYEAVHARPDGESTVARMAATAADHGYEGIVVRNHGGVADFEAAEIRARYGVDVVSGIEIHADDPAQASGYLGTYRQRAVVLVVHGGPTALNQFAVRQERVDVLAHPMREGDLNHVLVKAARDNGVRLEVNLARVLRSTGGQRVRALSGLRKLRELLRAYDAPFVVSTDPTSHLSIRGARELFAVGEAIGFEPEEIQVGLDEWGRIAETNRERLSTEFVEPGVTRGRYESERDNRAARGPEDAGERRGERTEANR